MYVVLSNGDIRNRYQIRITNKAAIMETYRIQARGVPPGALDLGHFDEVRVKPGHSALVQASVRLAPARAQTQKTFELVITPLSQPAQQRVERVRFDAPGHPA